MEKKIVALTTMCMDYFPETQKMYPGGEALNFAVRAGRYPEMAVSLVGGLGDDEFGDKILSFLKTQRIHLDGVHQIPGAVTAHNKIYIDAHGDRYFKEDSWTGGIDDIYHISGTDKMIISNADVVYTTCYSINLPELKALRDMSHFLLAVDFDVVRDFDRLRKESEGIDILMISGTEEMLDTFRSWSENSDILFNITLAERGSVSFYKGEMTRVDAVPVEKVVDTTGCGDNYHAAFIAEYLRTGDIRTAMIEAGNVAAAVLSGIGGANS